MDKTHDPELKSFIEVDTNSDFPIQNLPYCVFYLNIEPQFKARVGTAIGNYILDLSILENNGLFDGILPNNVSCFNKNSLNYLMDLGKPVWTKVRQKISSLLEINNPELRDNEELRSKSFFKMENCEFLIPVEIKEFTDFYSSKFHAQNVGTMIRGPENALMDNWLYLPVAYHGRSSSIILDEKPIHRPLGQTKNANESTPSFGSCKRLDYELELGYFVGKGNNIGEPIKISEAIDHIFGMALVNDWSARDIQVWEYRPLGPFLAKNFATSISPFVITLDALEPFKIEGQIQDPKPLPYLQCEKNYCFDIHLEVGIKTEKMDDYQIITKSNSKYLYWNMEQQLAHHTVSGCNMNTGDLFATGTISGPTYESRGCLLELSESGKKPIKLDSGEERTFLEDGDEICLYGYCSNDHYRIGFGKVRTKILPSINY